MRLRSSARTLAWAVALLMSGAALAQASPGVPSGPTKGAVGYSGRMSGVPGPVDLHFVFHPALGSTALCTGDATGVDLAADGSFSTEVVLSGCPFDGQDLAYDVSWSPAGAATFTVVATNLPVSPVPYAKYADVSADLAAQSGASRPYSLIDRDLQVNGTATVQNLVIPTGGTASVGIQSHACSGGVCTCPGGQTALGGGGTCPANSMIWASSPETSSGTTIGFPVKWAILCRDTTGASAQPTTTYVVCANLQ